MRPNSWWIFKHASFVRWWALCTSIVLLTTTTDLSIKHLVCRVVMLSSQIFDSNNNYRLVTSIRGLLKLVFFFVIAYFVLSTDFLKLLYSGKSLLNQLAVLACCCNLASGELSLGMVYGRVCVRKCEWPSWSIRADHPIPWWLRWQVWHWSNISGCASVCCPE
jgi:hypothetical protein